MDGMDEEDKRLPFWGRKHSLEVILRNFRKKHATAIAISGRRRVGKTSLLLKACDLFRTESPEKKATFLLPLSHDKYEFLSKASTILCPSADKMTEFNQLSKVLFSEMVKGSVIIFEEFHLVLPQFYNPHAAAENTLRCLAEAIRNVFSAIDLIDEGTRIDAYGLWPGKDFNASKQCQYGTMVFTGSNHTALLQTFSSDQPIYSVSPVRITLRQWWPSTVMDIIKWAQTSPSSDMSTEMLHFWTLYGGVPNYYKQHLANYQCFTIDSALSYIADVQKLFIDGGDGQIEALQAISQLTDRLDPTAFVIMQLLANLFACKRCEVSVADVFSSSFLFYGCWTYRGSSKITRAFKDLDPNELPKNLDPSAVTTRTIIDSLL